MKDRKEMTTPRKLPTPPWMRRDRDVKDFLARVFPQPTDRQRTQAKRLRVVIDQYFRRQSDRGAIAKELGVTVATVASLIQHIRRAANGERQDGVQRTGQPKGRPRKSPAAAPTERRPYHRKPRPALITLPVSEEIEFERFDDDQEDE